MEIIFYVFYLYLTTLLIFGPSTGIPSYPSDLVMTKSHSWMSDDWFREMSHQEIVINDENSGCICRLRWDHVVCYGGSSCASFPRNATLPLKSEDLRIKTTAIYKLESEALVGFLHLRRLDIDANFRLSEIEPGFFTGMSNLINMSISFNAELRYLHENTFLGLDHLERLRLIKNGFRNVLDVSKALKPSILPKIVTLSLSENVFREIYETSFTQMNGTNVRDLDLILCQIEKIHPNSLSSFRHLEQLRLGMNVFEQGELERLFNNMANKRIPIRLLNLYELGLRKGDKLTSLLKKISKLNVTHLNLRRNHIDNLYRGLFPPMPHLETLDLREVSAVDIEPNALNETLMPKLKNLLLGGNKFTGVSHGVLLPQLWNLDLSLNMGANTLPTYFDVNSNLFENMTNLISLNLSFNCIAALSNLTFNGMHKLRTLGLKNATIFYIAKNSFLTLQDLYLLNLEDNPLRPFNTFPEPIFEGLSNLEILLLSNCKIPYFIRPNIFQPLKELKYLNLRGNILVRIDSRLFKFLPILTGIDLSFNHMTSLDYHWRLFQYNPNLRAALLHHNRFTYLTASMLDDFTGISLLDISANPYVCDKILSEIAKSWLSLRNLLGKTVGFFDAPNVCLSPDKWRDKPLIDFLTDAEGFLENPHEENSSRYIEVSVLVFFVIFTVFAIIFYYRWHVRYWIFLLKTRFPTMTACPFKKRIKAEEIPFKYDAFVSYSHEDRNFVVGLVAKLENEEPYLKLCVYERDFEIGTIISETVLNKVNASRKIMFIVSNSFAKSQWCIWELHIAEYRRIFFRDDINNKFMNDSLVLIKVGPLMENFLTPILKYMLRTRIYLEWTSDYTRQKFFWEKLRNYLVTSKTTSSLNC